MIFGREDYELAVDGANGNSFRIITSGTDKAVEHWVVLTVHPFERIPHGAPDMTENPPRLPFVKASHKIHLISPADYEQYADHPYALTIGKIISDGNTLRVDARYIPPCYSVNAHEELKNFWLATKKNFDKLEEACRLIIRRIYEEERDSPIALAILDVCEKMFLCLGQTVMTLKWLPSHESPIYLFTTVCSFARQIRNVMCMTKAVQHREMERNFIALLTYVGQNAQDDEKLKLQKDYGNFDLNTCLEKRLISHNMTIMI